MDKEKFLRRMFIYRLKSIVASVLSIALFLLSSFFALKSYADKSYADMISGGNNFDGDFELTIVFASPFIAMSFFNLITYLYSKYMMKIYGASLFDDLDQDWLKESQGFGSEVFAEHFVRANQYRKVAGPYSLPIFIIVSLLGVPVLPIVVGILYIMFLFIYINVYFAIALEDKIPRAFGSGLVISRIIGLDLQEVLKKKKRRKKTEDNNVDKPEEKQIEQSRMKRNHERKDRK